MQKIRDSEREQDFQPFVPFRALMFFKSVVIVSCVRNSCSASAVLGMTITVAVVEVVVVQCLALKGSTSGLGSFLVQMTLNKIFDRKYRLN